MERTRSRAALARIVVAVLIAGGAPIPDARGWQPVSGRVVASDGAGIADVEVRAQLNAPPAVVAALGTPQPFVVGRSDADGRFRVDLPREAGAVAWDRVDGVVLVFGREGLRSHAEHLARARAARPVQVALARPDGGSQLAEGPRRKLEALRVAGNPAVFVLPHVVRGPLTGVPDDLAEQIRALLLRTVRRHLSAFALAIPLPELVPRSLDPRTVELDESVPLEALAAPLDALAVLGGRIEPAGTRGRLVIVSDVLVAPPSTRLPAIHRFEDTISAEPAQAIADVQRVLAPRWARLVVLSLAAAELRAALAANDAQRLRGVQQLVSQELRRAGRGNGDLVPQAQALQQDAEAALRRLGHR